MDVGTVLNDLLAEQDALDDVVAPLAPDQWSAPTPSPRWSVGDQIGHLTYFDTTAALAIRSPEDFRTHRSELTRRFDDDVAVDAATLGEFRRLSPVEQLTEWRHRRAELADAAKTLTDETRVEWYGPSMGSKSFLTARLMEVWAHGQDICDTVGAERPATDRLRHVAQLGVITRGWSYAVRGEQAPDEPVHVRLAAPSGAVWTWGDAADHRIDGPALDFCRVVTQRRHVDDTALQVSGWAAIDWMGKAQAFAGSPTTGPAAGQRSRKN